MAHFISHKMVALARISHGQRSEPWPGTFGSSFFKSTFRKSGLFQRDGFDCYWCKRPMREDVKNTHPDVVTIEHLTRRFDGGSEHQDNLALAHKRCNCDRHAGPLLAAYDRQRDPNKVRIAANARCSKIIGGMWKGAHIIAPLPRHEDEPQSLAA